MNPILSIEMPSWVAGLKVVTSKCNTCNRTLALRQLSARKAGIRMRGAWYCSSACFTLAAEKEFSELMRSAAEQTGHVSRMPLGLILVSRGLLTTSQLREATEEQKKTGGEIGELLVRRGAVNESQVTAVRATQWGCPVFSMPNHFAKDTIRVPATLLNLYSAVPLHYVAATKLVLVGFVQSVEYGMLYAIEQMTGCKTQPCFVTPNDYEVHMERQRQAEAKDEAAPPNEVRLEDVQTAEEMASILCSYGVDLEADEVMLARCKGYLWTRLKSGDKVSDLLFKTAWLT